MSNVKSGRQYIDAKRIKNSSPWDIANIIIIIIIIIIIHLLMVLAAGGLDAPGCKFLSCWWAAMARLLDTPPGTTTEADEDDAIELSFEIVLLVVVVVGVPETAWPVWPSTGFLERWRPLFMCLSQYFWSATASLEHRHFLPSVLRHLPGSGSVLLENPRWKEPHPTWHTQNNQMKKHPKSRTR